MVGKWSGVGGVSGVRFRAARTEVQHAFYAFLTGASF